MEELNQRPRTRAALFAADCGDRDIDRSLAELRALAESAEMEVLLEIVQRRDTPVAGCYLGDGRLAEAKSLCADNDVAVCVFDDELTGTQIKNLEDALELPVVDRTLLGNAEVTPMVCLVVCLTVLFVVVFAKCVGCSLPLLAEKVGLDPAVMASPFISTVVDATSLLIYFRFASWLLGI